MKGNICYAVIRFYDGNGKCIYIYNISKTKLKVDRPRQRDCLHKPPDYRHKDKVHRLVIVLLTKNLRVIAFSCTMQAESLISAAARQTFDHDL